MPSETYRVTGSGDGGQGATIFVRPPITEHKRGEVISALENRMRRGNTGAALSHESHDKNESSVRVNRFSRQQGPERAQQNIVAHQAAQLMVEAIHLAGLRAENDVRS